jgi:hypothetical protein
MARRGTAFVNLGDLEPGQHLAAAGGSSLTVTAVQSYARQATVYDLTVDSVPYDWDVDQILDSVAEVATNPNSVWKQQTGLPGSLCTGGRGSVTLVDRRSGRWVDIRVIFEPATDRIVSGFPYEW